jgi:hypothetical protein
MSRIWSAGVSTNCRPVSRARVTIPMIIVIATAPSSSSVVAALRLFGGLNAGTPLEMASTPVRAAHPDENVRRIRNANANVVRSSCPGSGTTCSPALGARRSSPRTKIRKNPVSSMPIITIMNP